MTPDGPANGDGPDVRAPGGPAARPRHAWSFEVARVGGVPIRIHATFWLFLLWVWWAASSTGHSPGMQVGLVSSVFFCVVLHELGHVLVARRFGIPTQSITLYPIGGISRLRSMGEASQELWIALAGPVVSLLIGGGIWLALVAAGRSIDWTAVASGRGGFLEWLAVANLVLAAFNLLPAFPMDGGRALRAGLALRLGRSRATEIAARIGQMFAIVLGAFGVFGGNLILVLIAVFLFLGAQGEASLQTLRDLARGHHVADAMVTEFVILGTDATVGDAVEHLLRGEQKVFPVATDGTHVGLLTQEALIQALAERGRLAPARDAAVPVERVAHPADELEPWVQRMAGDRGSRAVPVVEDGRTVGLLTWENVMELFAVDRARRA